MDEDASLQRLAELRGIESHYLDEGGEYRRPPVSTHRALLTSLGHDVASASAIAEAIHTLETGPWLSPLPPSLVVRTPSPTTPSVPLCLAESRSQETLAWEWIEESGASSHGEFRADSLPLIDSRIIDGVQRERRAMTLPQMPDQGYHRLRLWIGGEAHERSVIGVPERCHIPFHIERGYGDWGFATQLYGLRSEHGWGMGDFTDLRNLIRNAGSMGAAAIGLNPLHALRLDDPRRASPYSPTSRLMLNVLYLDVEACPGFSDCQPLQEKVRNPVFHMALAAARQAERVDYPQVARLKLDALRLLHRSTMGRTDEAFQKFKVEAGEPLRSWALFETLKEHFGPGPWWTWPAGYRDPTLPAVAEFARAQAETVDFFEYLQWQAESQLAAAAAESRYYLRIGLYHDLALGVDRDSAEAWSAPSLFVGGVIVGSPPDDYNRRGQDWGIAPMDGSRLRALSYAPFAAMLRSCMKHAGAIRLDHAMQLQRLFWIPEGAAPTEGTYVRQPFEDLVGVLALESRRQQCLVIGEDLGTVPGGFRARMDRAGVLSYRLLYFQQDSLRGFQQPYTYPALSAVVVGTHDLPTLSAWWSAKDIELRRSLGLYASDDEAERAIAHRGSERRNLLAAMIEEGVLSLPAPDPNEELTPELVLAIHEFLARSPGRLMMVRMEDMLGVDEQTNLPGTVDEHPNWQSRLPIDLETLFDDPRVRAMAALLRRCRPQPESSA